MWVWLAWSLTQHSPQFVFWELTEGALISLLLLHVLLSLTYQGVPVRMKHRGRCIFFFATAGILMAQLFLTVRVQSQVLSASFSHCSQTLSLKFRRQPNVYCQRQKPKEKKSNPETRGPSHLLLLWVMARLAAALHMAFILLLTHSCVPVSNAHQTYSLLPSCEDNRFKPFCLASQGCHHLFEWHPPFMHTLDPSLRSYV